MSHLSNDKWEQICDFYERGISLKEALKGQDENTQKAIVSYYERRQELAQELTAA